MSRTWRSFGAPKMTETAWDEGPKVIGGARVPLRWLLLPVRSLLNATPHLILAFPGAGGSQHEQNLEVLWSPQNVRNTWGLGSEGDEVGEFSCVGFVCLSNASRRLIHTWFWPFLGWGEANMSRTWRSFGAPRMPETGGD